MTPLTAQDLRPETLADYCDTFTAGYRHNRLWIKLASRWTNFDVLLAILIAEAELVTGVRERGLTMTELKASQKASFRTIQTLVTILRLYGFLTLAPSPGDARIKHVLSTPKLLTLVRHLLDGALTALDRARDRPNGHSTNLLSHDGIFRRFAARAGPAYFAGELAIERFPAIAYFSARTAGFQMLACLMSAHYRRLPPDDFARLAESFNVSRAHVHNILTDARQHGWVEFSPGGRELRVTTDLIRTFEDYTAHELTFLEQHLRAAADPS